MICRIGFDEKEKFEKEEREEGYFKRKFRREKGFVFLEIIWQGVVEDENRDGKQRCNDEEFYISFLRLF